MAGNDIWPTEVRLRDGGKKLAVAFDNGESYEMTAEYLRVESPSAEIQGHSPLERKYIGGKKNVKISEMDSSPTISAPNVETSTPPMPNVAGRPQ